MTRCQFSLCRRKTESRLYRESHYVMTTNMFALEAFLQNYRGDDVFKHMKESESELLIPFLSWDKKINLKLIKIDGSDTMECILDWVLELWKEKNERLVLTNWRERLEKYIETGSASATKLWLSIPKINPSLDYNWAARQASRNGHFEIVSQLLADPRVDPSAQDYIIVREAVKRGHLDVLKVLLKDDRIDPAYDNNRMLHMATEHGHSDAVDVLLADPRVDPTARDCKALHAAVINGHVYIVKALLEDGRSDPIGTIPLAIERGYIHIVRLLLADPRVDPRADNNSALRTAIRCRHLNGLQIVDLLLADPRIDPKEAIRHITQYYPRW